MKIAALCKKALKIRSFDDARFRLGELLKLAFRKATGKYGPAYWADLQKKHLDALSRAAEQPPSDHKNKMSPPHRIFWNWDIIKTCNYKCAYCFYANCDNTGTLFLNPDQWFAIWERLRCLYGECHIHVAGGEPSIYPGFFDLLDRLSARHILEITTNLSFEPDRIVGKIPPERIKITASYHPTQENFDIFFRKIVRLAEHGYFIAAASVANPDHLKKMGHYKAEIEKLGIDFIVQPLRGTFLEKKYPAAYSAEDWELLKELSKKNFTPRPNKYPMRRRNQTNAATEMIRFNESEGKTVFEKCRMGQLYGKIYSDGSVYRCCAPDSRKIGMITDPDFRLLPYPLTCDSEKCTCYKAMLVSRQDWLGLWPA